MMDLVPDKHFFLTAIERVNLSVDQMMMNENLFTHTHPLYSIHTNQPYLSFSLLWQSLLSFLTPALLSFVNVQLKNTRCMWSSMRSAVLYERERERKEGNWCLLTCKQKHARWKIKNKWRLFDYDHRTYFYIKSFSVRIQFNFDVYSTKGKLLNYTCHFYYSITIFSYPSMKTKVCIVSKWHLPNPYYYYLSMMIKNHLS